MTEDLAATPGWLERRLDEVLADLPPGAALKQARADYLRCLVRHKAPSVPSDLLGEEFASCRRALHLALMPLHLPRAAAEELDRRLEALEAEFDAEA